MKFIIRKVICVIILLSYSCSKEDVNPVLKVEPKTLDFGVSDYFGISDNNEFIIRNDADSNVPLSYSIDFENKENGNIFNWDTISFGHYNGDIEGNDFHYISVKLKRDLIKGVNFDRNIMISSNGGNEVIRLKALGQSQLRWEPPRLDFNPVDNVKYLKIITNPPETNLIYEIVDEDLWIPALLSFELVSSKPGEDLYKFTYDFNGYYQQNGESNGGFNQELNIYSEDLGMYSYNDAIGPWMSFITGANDKAYVSIKPDTLFIPKTAKTANMVVQNMGTQPAALRVNVKDNKPGLLVPSTSINLPKVMNSSLVIPIEGRRYNAEIGETEYILETNVHPNFYSTPDTKEIVVKLETGLGEVTYAPNILNYSSDLSAIDLAISNSSENMVDYILSSEDQWIEINNPLGSVGLDETQQIKVDLKREIMESGNYNGKITIQANDEQFLQGKDLDVSAIIPNPNLSVSSNSLNIGVGTIKASLSVTNSGGGFLEWNYIDNNDLIKCTPEFQTININTASNVVIRYDKVKVKIGSYNAIFNIESNGGTESIELNVVKGFPEPEKVYTSYNQIGDCYDISFKEGDDRFYYSPRYNTGIAILSGSEVDEYHSVASSIDGDGFTINNDDNLIYCSSNSSVVVIDYNYNVIGEVDLGRGIEDLDYKDGSLFSIGFSNILQRFNANGFALQEQIDLDNVIGKDIAVGFVSTDSNSLEGYVLTDHIDSTSNSDYSQIIKIEKSGSTYIVVSRYNLPTNFRVTGMALNPNNDHIYISARDRICLMVPEFYLD